MSKGRKGWLGGRTGGVGMVEGKDLVAAEALVAAAAALLFLFLEKMMGFHGKSS